MINLQKNPLIPPEEVHHVCPYCTSLKTTIEKWNNGYPYIRCLECQISFYAVDLRSGCKYWNKSVTSEICKSCVFFNPQIQCVNWVGILEPPKDLKNAIKQNQPHNKQGLEFFKKHAS